MKLLDQVRHVIRKKHYSYRTEQSYIDWIKRKQMGVKSAVDSW